MLLFFKKSELEANIILNTQTVTQEPLSDGNDMKSLLGFATQHFLSSMNQVSCIKFFKIVL